MTTKDLPDEVYRKIVSNYLRSVGFKRGSSCEIVSHEFTPLSEDHSGYFGFGGWIQISLELDFGPLYLKLFVKRPPTGNDYQEEYVKRMNVFEKESVFYKKLAPQLMMFTNEAILPKCYYSTRELIVLEDLSKLGYRTLPDTTVYEVKHCRLVLSLLAKLHAASVILEYKNKIKIDKLYSGIHTEAVYKTDPNHLCIKWLNAGAKTMKIIFDQHFSLFYSADALKQAFQTMDHLPGRILELKAQGKCRALCHCDVWNNNIMVREKGQYIDSVKLIDFQLIRYCSPAYDILQFLYTTTSPEFRSEHFDHLLKFYYGLFCHQLDVYKVPIESAWTWSQLLYDIELYKPSMMALSLLYLHFILIPKDVMSPLVNSSDKYKQLAEQERSQLVNQVLSTNPIYKHRLIHAIVEYLEYWRC